MAELLITGGAGFIGSHTCLVLLQAGHRPVVLDDSSNGEAAARLVLMQGDSRSTSQLVQAFAKASTPIDAVIHFAGLKAVGESLQ